MEDSWAGNHSALLNHRRLKSIDRFLRHLHKRILQSVLVWHDRTNTVLCCLFCSLAYLLLVA